MDDQVAFIPDVNTGKNRRENIKAFRQKIKDWITASETMYYVFLPLMFIINYGLNQLPEWASMLLQCLLLICIGSRVSREGTNHVLKYYISLGFFFHLSYKFNRFKKEGSLMGSLSTCSWDRNRSNTNNYCYNVLDYITPGLCVPWIGLIAETITDVLLGIGKTFFIFIKDYNGTETVKLLLALGGGSLITLLFQYALKFVEMFRGRHNLE